MDSLINRIVTAGQQAALAAVLFIAPAISVAHRAAREMQATMGIVALAAMAVATEWVAMAEAAAGEEAKKLSPILYQFDAFNYNELEI